MDPINLFEYLTWADLIIIGDELNVIRDFDSKMLKHQELQTVCSQLKIKGRGIHQKRQWSRESVNMRCKLNPEYEKLVVTENGVKVLMYIW